MSDRLILEQQQEIARLNALIKRISYNRQTGVMTRERADYELEIRDLTSYAAIFLDLDGLKQHNLDGGKVLASLKMRNSLGRLEDWTYHAFSGDEYVIMVSIDDVLGAIDRLGIALMLQGLTATFAVGLPHEIDMLDDKVDEAKKAGIRGVIVYSSILIGESDGS